ncbi:Glutamyl-tRNA(Gln) amidotransferase subunit A [Hartmannibacter diazotrophicus]|uniref:Glutamyl-tRNA(Gln) amidotransferase subunit A n=1 Tax=Hartmannibacter diazotrophicus TaxID=1482074 RepID=A0A2C9DAN3_9HYPH|nr:amidase [Hartmannibacter diazotrophicus]SON56801.1 Glutamyl-tRNA(Gln) amidotransferase subunit A [Hartmannibacter diazotrophicus]
MNDDILDSLADLSLMEAAGALRAGKTSSRALTQAMLDRIERHDGRLHAYVHVAADAALARAEAMDRERASGTDRGPLHGIPIAVKDVFWTKGMPTRFGTTVFDDWTAPEDATVIRRLEAAGAVLLGKLTLTEGVYAGYHPSVVEPINPYGAKHWTGNSSSGSGVALASRLCYGSLGTDTGGSIRLPSACCGVTGIKPTWGRVSRHGVFPLAHSLDHVGSMARTAADAAAILSVIAGADSHDPTASVTAVPDYLAGIDGGIAGLKIGVDRDLIARKADGEVLASIEAALEVVRRLGAQIVPVRFPETDAILHGWAVECAVEAALAHADTYPARKTDYGERLSSLLERGHRYTAFDLARAQEARRRFRGEMAAMMAGIDLYLCPALPVAGPSLDFMASLGEDPAAILAIGPFTAPFDVAGLPTITLPCGQSSAGIPIAFQFAGKAFDEGLICRAGHAYQQVTTHHRLSPDLS